MPYTGEQGRSCSPCSSALLLALQLHCHPGRLLLEGCAFLAVGCLFYSCSRGENGLTVRKATAEVVESTCGHARFRLAFSHTRSPRGAPWETVHEINKIANETERKENGKGCCGEKGGNASATEPSRSTHRDTATRCERCANSLPTFEHKRLPCSASPCHLPASTSSAPTHLQSAQCAFSSETDKVASPHQYLFSCSAYNSAPQRHHGRKYNAGPGQACRPQEGFRRRTQGEGLLLYLCG